MDAELRRALVLAKHSGRAPLLITELLDEIDLTVEECMGIHVAASMAATRGRERRQEVQVWAPTPHLVGKGVLHRWARVLKGEGYGTLCGLMTLADRTWLKSMAVVDSGQWVTAPWRHCQGCRRYSRVAVMLKDVQ